MFVHDNNVSVSCTVPLLTLIRLRIYRSHTENSTAPLFNNILWWVRVRGWVRVRVGVRVRVRKVLGSR